MVQNPATDNIGFPQMGNFKCAYILVYNNNALLLTYDCKHLLIIKEVQNNVSGK